MKQMHRFLALFLAVLLVGLTLASCTKDPVVTPGSDTAGSTNPPVTVPDGLYVGETALSEYTIVIPAEADYFSQASAEFLQSYLKETWNLELTLTDDSAEASAHEILIGSTNRSSGADAAAAEYAKMQYAAYVNGSSVVLYGNYMMTSGAVSALIYNVLAPAKEAGGADIAKALGTTLSTKTYEFTADPDSAILLIGDGHSYNHYYYALSNGLDHFYGFDFPALGYSASQCVTGFTDSGAGGTALATGYKTWSGSIAMDVYIQPLKTLCELAWEKEMVTAVISDDSETGATPADFYAHAPHRSDDEIIATFHDNVNYLHCSLGLSEIAPEILTAINTVAPNGEPFFIMAEEGETDSGSHSNRYDKVYQGVVTLNEMIAVSAQYAFMNPGVIVIVAADHETGGVGGVIRNDGVYNADELTFSSNDHTTKITPFLVLGKNAEQFNNEIVQNTDVSKFIATAVMKDETFGDSTAKIVTADPVTVISSTGDGEENGLKYELYSDGTATVIGCTDQAVTAVTIPGTLGGSPVTAIAVGAFRDCAALADVTIPDSVVKIGYEAFAGTPYLTAQTDEFVVVGGGVLLKYNGSATDVVLPAGIVSISEAFKDRSDLLSITLNEGLKAIGDYAFYGCKKIAGDIVFPEGMSSVGDYSFYDCRKVTTYTFPESCRTIGAYTFYRNEKMTDVYFPSTMDSFGEGAFYYCPALGDANLPEGLVKLPASCFEKCESLGAVVLPHTLRKIGDRCFANDGCLNGVMVQQGLETIGAYAFYKCNRMFIELPDTVVSIGEYALAYVAAGTIIVPDTVKSMGESALYGSSVDNLVIRSSGEIPANACGAMESLTLLLLGENVTGAAAGAFADTKNLVKIYYEGTQEQWEAFIANVAAEGNDVLLHTEMEFAGR